MNLWFEGQVLDGFLTVEKRAMLSQWSVSHLTDWSTEPVHFSLKLKDCQSMSLKKHE